MTLNITAVGIDGCRNGWIAACLHPAGSEIRHFSTIAALMEQYAHADVLFIDIPVGLARNTAEARFRPEQYARKLIPRKAAAIFNAPCQKAAYCRTYAEANETNKATIGKGLSKQSYHICNKIREVDTFIKENPALRDKLMESHPEICFALMHPSLQPILENKKTAVGRRKRLQTLQSMEKEAKYIEENIASVKELQQVQDDVIDAFCLAVAAKFGIINGFRTIPEQPRRNNEGIWMQMVVFQTK